MNSSATGKIGVTSGGIAAIPFIDVFLGARTCRVTSGSARSDLVAVAGWGTKPSGLRAAELAARRAGAARVALHAQLAARSLYLRAGYAERGAPFVEAGIGHVAMERRLDA